VIGERVGRASATVWDPVLMLLNVGRGILYATHAIGPCS
jgi:hypothetical protein